MEILFSVVLKNVLDSSIIQLHLKASLDSVKFG